MSKELITNHESLITDHLSDDLQFLIACCQAEPTQNDIDFISSYLSQITNHESLLELNSDTPVVKTKVGCIILAHKHGVLPLVYKTLKRLSKEGLLRDTSDVNRNTDNFHPSSHSGLDPESKESQSDSPHPSRNTLEHLLANLKSAYTQIARRNMLMTAELLRIMKLLEANNIEALAFKGPALAQQAYGDITMRQFGDLDILIPKDKISKIDTIFQSENYTYNLEPISRYKNIWIQYSKDLEYFHSKKNILIEMHWSLLPQKYPLNFDIKEIWSNTTKCSINNRLIKTFSMETLLLYLCIHGSKHRWERIEWIKDIDALVRHQEINWEKVFIMAKKSGFKNMLDLGLILSKNLFDTPLQKVVLNKRMTAIVPFIFSNWQNKKNVFEKVIYMLKLLPNTRSRFYYTAISTVNPTLDDYKIIVLPSSLHWIYYIIRPFVLIHKYIIKN